MAKYLPPTRQDLTQGRLIVGVKWGGGVEHELRLEPCQTYTGHWLTRGNVSQMSPQLDLDSLDILRESGTDACI